MKYYAFLFYAFIGLLLHSACRDFRPEIPIPDPSHDYGNIRFDSMAIGQKSRYLSLWGENYYSSSTDDFGYFDDTLQLEIVGYDANGYKVKETLHYLGDVHHWLTPDKDSVYYYYFKLEGNTLKIAPSQGNFSHSRIIAYHTGQQGLNLTEIPSPLVEIKGWKTSWPYCECARTGYAENYTLFGVNYPRLNVLVNNAPMSFDGNGETYVYAKERGIVRFSTYSWWFQNGMGWDLLP